MIMLTFDDAINQDNWELYNNVIFNDRKNPNGCPIRVSESSSIANGVVCELFVVRGNDQLFATLPFQSTFYVSHQYTNYQHLQKLWNDGHEISVHSVR